MSSSKIKYLYIFVFLLYISLAFIVGYNHEPWADEAQSWLISRDNSYFDIFKETKYEGHPFVWFYILRTFIKIFSVFMDPVQLYNWIFILPLILSSIAVYLLLFKSKLPFWIKILSPFTFYIFFQYGIVARNHCLCFPMLALVATFYQKRFEHPFIYIILLILNANSSAYLYPISLVLLIYFVIDIIKNKNDISLKKYGIASLICLLLLVATGIHMYNPSDCYFWGGIDRSYSHLRYSMVNLAGIYFPKKDINYIIVSYLIMTLLLYISAKRVYCKNISQIILFILLNLPLYILYIYLYSQPWHYGYAFIILLFTCWLLTDINDIKNIPFKKNILFYILMLFILGYSVAGNIKVCYYDMKSNYCGSKDAVQFIKKYNLQNYSIIGFGMKTVAFQPYFDRNIYSNYTDVTHFSWHDKFYEQYSKKRLEYAPIIVVAEDDFRNDGDEYLNDFEKNSEDYYKYFFNGKMRGINYKHGSYEDNSYTIYVDKKLADSLNIKQSIN